MEQNTQLAVKPQTTTGLSVFDSGQFEQMWVVADAIAQSSLVPASLQGKTKEETKANCLRVVEQSQRWGFSPFAVMDCASVVHGKLMWEGKLVAAAITALLGFRLTYAYSGSGQNLSVLVSGQFPDESEARTIQGSVADWKTTGKGSPWDKASQHEQMLSYRGAREWARRHSPGTILGVYSPDEFNEDELKEATGRVVERETQIDPKSTSPEIETTPEATPEATPTTTSEPEGRQKKQRHKKTAELVGVVERSTEDMKPFFVVTLNNGQKNADLITFSQTMGKNLRELDKGTMLDIVFTQSDGGLNLESYELVENGGLI
jgi:hypothetical protein